MSERPTPETDAIASKMRTTGEWGGHARRLERERDTLAAWKEGHLKVNEWWAEVDRIVREHPDTIIGRTVADEAVRLIQERDKFLSLLKRAEPHMRHGLNCPARIGEGHACECGMLDVWKAAKEAIQ